MRVSLHDVARAAGVALSTASRAMTGSSEVGAATRARILETASEMGYRPNLAAQTLRSGRSYLIELEVPDHLPEGVLKLVFDSCESRGYHLLLTSRYSQSVALAPVPAVDGRILFEPSRHDAADERAVVLDISDLISSEQSNIVHHAVNRLIDRLETSSI